MKKIFIAGNWKMNMNLLDSKNYFKELINLIDNQKQTNIEMLICPPSLHIIEAMNLTKDSDIKIGAQNVSSHDNGAYTGEISSKMLSSINLPYVIIGHSERRKYFGETDEIINIKIQKSLQDDLTPILCVGESENERNQGSTFKVIQNQLELCLKDVNLNSNDIVIAYEPLWAIGTGKTATPEMAEEVHQFIRNWLQDNYSLDISDKIHILYGGSVKPKNIKELLSMKNIDGGLVGGASLNPNSFYKMVKIVEKIER